MTGSSCLTSSRTEPGSHECSAGRLEGWCTLPGSAPNLHLTEEAPLNSILLQACFREFSWQGDWSSFCRMAGMWPLEEGKANVLYGRKGSQTKWNPVPSSWSTVAEAFVEEQTPVSFLKHWKDWLGQCGPDILSQRSKVVSSYAGRKYIDFHGKICSGNNWVSLVQCVWEPQVGILKWGSLKGGIQ